MKIYHHCFFFEMTACGRKPSRKWEDVELKADDVEIRTKSGKRQF